MKYEVWYWCHNEEDASPWFETDNLNEAKNSCKSCYEENADVDTIKVLNKKNEVIYEYSAERKEKPFTKLRVACNYYNNDEHCWCIDGWLTDDENEEGFTICKIHKPDNAVTWLHPKYKNNEAVKQKVSEVTLSKNYDKEN